MQDTGEYVLTSQESGLFRLWEGHTIQKEESVELEWDLDINLSFWRLSLVAYLLRQNVVGVRNVVAL
jgi:hypothetical protein